MYINRDSYLSQLKAARFNGQVKVITGLRRCGKSFLLFTIFRDFLLSEGVKDDNIISLALDEDVNEQYRDTAKLSKYIRSRITDQNRQYYVLLDEVQYAISKAELKKIASPIRLYGVLNGLLHLKNVDVYVTGSNSKFLSTDIMTEFRGRGDVIPVYPLSFSEYYSFVGGDKAEAYEDYALYGGMPLVLSRDTPEKKLKYLKDLFSEIYFKDISERYDIKCEDVLEQLTDDLCSSIGSLTNANKIARTLSSLRGKNVDKTTIASYLRYLSDSLLFSEAKRYDIKGKKYFEYPSKFYCTDIGLRNARLNFRQQEESHIMENIIFNELMSRGYAVDVGVVETNDVSKMKQCEIDFVVNRGMSKYYIQSALHMDDPEKSTQELRPFLAVKDFFKRIVVTKTMARPWIDDFGIFHIGLYDFLLDQNSLEGYIL